jgi:hypothetical protein
MQENVLKWAILLFVSFCGLFLAGTGIWGIYNSYVLEKAGVTCLGTVDRIKHFSNAESEGLRFRVHFTYRQQDYYLHNQFMDSDSIYHLQQPVEVLFLPTQPQDAIINSDKEKYQGHAIMLLLGVLTTAIGFAIRYGKRWV